MIYSGSLADVDLREEDTSDGSLHGDDNQGHEDGRRQMDLAKLRQWWEGHLSFCMLAPLDKRQPSDKTKNVTKKPICPVLELQLGQANPVVRKKGWNP